MLLQHMGPHFCYFLNTYYFEFQHFQLVSLNLLIEFNCLISHLHQTLAVFQIF